MTGRTEEYELLDLLGQIIQNRAGIDQKRPGAEQDALPKCIAIAASWLEDRARKQIGPNEICAGQMLERRSAV